MNRNIPQYDIIRTITMLLVIIGHVEYTRISSSLVEGGINYDSIYFSPSSFAVRTIIDVIYSFHMPLFMALSGALFYIGVNRSGQEIDNKKFISKKAKRLLIPFVCISLFFSIPIKYLTGYWDNGTGLMCILKSQLLGWGNSHLWFVVALFWINILSYVFQAKVKTIRKTGLFLIVLWIISIVTTLLSERLPDALWIKSAIGYLFYYYCGYFFESRRRDIDIWLSENKNSWLQAIIIFSLISSIHYFAYYGGIPGYIIKTTHSILYLSVRAIAGLWMMYTICYTFTNSRISNKVQKSKSYLYLRSKSYDLYLYSDPLNYLVLYVLSIVGVSFMTESGFLLMVVSRLIGSLFGAMIIIKIIDFGKSSFKKARYTVLN